MVTNSFGNRNFMQPMGRPKHALALFLLSFFGGGRGEEDFFHFPLVLNVFPLCSLQIHIRFSMCSS
jgi:hypothetical protein